MTAVWLWSAGITAPGMADWASGRAVLAGQAQLASEPLAPFKPALLPPNERRRTTRTIKLALQVAQQAIEGLERPAAELATVFASSCGDTEVAVRICGALTEPGRPVSPIQFHNSVHNAPAGYWSIARQSTAPSTSISAYDWTFATGLLEAATQVQGEGRPVLLTAYDLPPPAPLSQARPLRAPLGVALLLGPGRRPGGDDLGALRLSLSAEGEETPCDTPELEALRRGNPAGRGLPLLQALAGGRSCNLTLPYAPASGLAVEYGAP